MPINPVDSVTYGDVLLHIVDTELFDKQFVKNGPDYVCTLFTLKIKAIYNPDATSYRNPPPGHVAAAGKLAPETEVAIRNALLAPRKKLTYQIGSIVVLESPRGDDLVDAQNGPVPQSLEVEKIYGEKTFSVVWTVQTWVREKYLVSMETAHPLISNRWSCNHHLTGSEGQWREIITFRGTSVFDSAVLQSDGFVPDEYREFILPPVPRGFRRDSIDVTVNPENVSVDWVVTDIRTRLSLKQAGVTRIDCIKRVRLHSPTPLGSVMRAAGLGYKIARGAYEMYTNTTNPQTGERSRSTGAERAFFGAMEGIESILPVRQISVMIRVYGTSTADMSTLQLIAFRVMAYHATLEAANQNPVGVLPWQFAVDSEETHDTSNGTVELSATFVSGIVGNAMALFTSQPFVQNVGPAGSHMNVILAVPDNDTHPSISALEAIPPVRGAHEPTFGQRDWYGKPAIAQVLQDMFARPSRHQDPIPDAGFPNDPNL